MFFKTEAQTTPELMVDFNIGTGNHTESYISHPFFPTVFNNKVYYIGQDSFSGHELCVTAGDSASTQIVVDFNAGYDATFDYFNNAAGIGVNFANNMVFVANASSYNAELLKSDGTSSGTKVVRDFNGAYSSSNPRGITVFNNHLFVGFTVFDTNYNQNNYLYVFDTLFNAVDSFSNIDIGQPFVFNGQLYYSVYFDTLRQYGLIKIDSNFNVSSIFCNADIISKFSDIGVLDSIVLIGAYSNSMGEELFYFQTDSVRLFLDINNGSGSSSPQNFSFYKDRLLFSADDGAKGNELWSTDGTVSGTKLLKDIALGNASSYPLGFKDYNNRLFFTAYDTALGYELWKTDGSDSGTTLVKDIFKEVYNYDKNTRDVKNLYVHNNKLYFSAYTSSFGYELFVSKGDTGSTQLVYNINPDDNDFLNAPMNFITYDKQFYFQAYTPDLGFEWYFLADTLEDNVIFTSNALGPDTTICGYYTISIDSQYTAVLWNDSSTNNTRVFTNSGVYWVELLDSNNNKFIDSIHLTIHNLPQFSLGNDTAVCESFTLNAPTGYTNVWNDNSTNNTLSINKTGVYWLEITDKNTCKNRDSIDVTIHNLPQFSLGNDTAVCESFTLNAPTGYTNLWNDNSTNNTLSINKTGVYWLEITDKNTCKNRDSIDVTIHNLPQFSLGNDTAVCESFTLNAPTGYTNVWNDNSTNNALSINKTGVYWLEITDKNTCKNRDSIDVTIHNLPQFSLGNDTAVCESFTLNAPTGYTNLWNDNSTNNTLSINKTGVYWLEVTDKNTCKNRDSIDVTIHNLPQFSLGNDTAVCESFTLNAPTGYTNVWNDNSTNNTLSINKTGVYWLEITDKNTCKNRDSIDVTIHNLPQFSLGNDTAVCESFTLNAPTGYTNVWNDNSTNNTLSINKTGVYWLEITDKNTCKNRDSIDVTIHNLPQFSLGNDTAVCESFTLNAPTGYTNVWNDNSTNNTLNINKTGVYWLEITDKNTCKNRDSIDVTIHNLPQFNLGNDTAVCESFTLNAPTGYTNLWNDNSTNNTLSINKTGVYWLEVTDKNTCKNRDSIDVTIHNLPQFSLGNDTAVCESFTLNAPTGYTNVWNDNSTNNTLSINKTGVYWLEVTDKNTCKNRDSIDVTIHDLPQFSLGNDTAVCESFTLNAPTGYTNVWNDNSTNNTLSINKTGVYWLEVTDKNTCKNRDSIDVTIHNLPQFSLGNDTAVCESFTLNAPTGYTNFWNDNSTNNTLSINKTGVYWLEITDKNTCKNRDSIDVTIHNLPQFSLGNDTAVCESFTLNAPTGYTNLWNDNSTNNTLSINKTGVYWLEVTDKNTCKNRDSIDVTIHNLPQFSLGNDTAVCESFTLNAPTGYTNVWNDNSTNNALSINKTGVYWLEITDKNTCKNRDSIDVTIHNLPQFSLGNDTAVCESFTLNAPTGYTNVWNDNSTNNTLSINKTGVYWLEITDKNTCKNRDSIDVTIHNLPQFSLGNDTILCEIKGFKIFAPVGFKYLWSNGDTSLTLQVASPNTYTLAITDGNNCMFTDSINIYQGEIPKLVINDTFKSCDSVLIYTSFFNKYMWNNVEGDSVFTSYQSETINLKVYSKDGCFTEANIQSIVEFAPKESSIEFETNNLEVQFKYPNLEKNTSLVWYFGTGDSSTLTEPKFVYKNYGAYKVVLKIYNDCGEIYIDSVLNLQNTGMISTIKSKPMIIYPNPTSDIITIKGLSEKGFTYIYDSNGKLVKISSENEINIVDLDEGIYYLKIFNNNNEIIGVTKVVLAK